jgi:hypothetical protein
VPILATSEAVALSPRLVEKLNVAPRTLHFFPLARRVIAFLDHLLLEGFRHGADIKFVLCEGLVPMAVHEAVLKYTPLILRHQQSAVVRPDPSITCPLVAHGGGHSHDAQSV